MIVDLLRNDLGRISRPGSVTWADVFQVERYETVWQLTTTVSAELDAEHRAGRASSAGCSRADRSRARRRSARWRSSASSRTRLAGSTAARWATSRRRAPGSPTPGSTSRSARSRWTPPRTTAEYGVGGGITWDSDAGAEYEETVAKSRVLTARRPDFELLETMRFDPAEGVRHLDRHLGRLAGLRRLLRLPRRRDRRPRGRGEDRRVRAARRDAASGSRSRQGRHGTGGGHAARRATPTRSASRSTTSPRILATSSCSTRRRCARGTRRRGAAIRTPTTSCSSTTEARSTESTIANVAVRIDGRWVTPPLDAGLLPGIGRAVALEEGSRGRGGR